MEDFNFDTLNTMLQHTSKWVGCELSPGILKGGISAETGKGLYTMKNLKKGQLLFSHEVNGPSLLNLSSDIQFRGTESPNTTSSSDDVKLNAIISRVSKSGLKTNTYTRHDFFGTTITLMVEMPFLSSSHLGAYLAWLPTCFPLSTALDRQELDSPMLWAAEERQHLQNTSVLRSLQHFESSSRQKFQEVVLQSKPLCEYLCAVGLPSEDEKWQFFKFCACVVQAYSFTINSDVDEQHNSHDDESGSGSDSDSASYHLLTSTSINTMIPLMDAFNASNARQNVQLIIDTKRNLLECRTTCRVAAGAELFNTFGVMSTADRIIKYGYVEDQDEYLLQFTLLDIIHALEQSSWREILELTLPDFFSDAPALSSRKRNRNGLVDYDRGHAMVKTVQQQWIKTGHCEDFFPMEEFKVSCLTSSCMFEVEDFLDSEDEDQDADGDGAVNDSDGDTSSGGRSRSSDSISDSGDDVVNDSDSDSDRDKDSDTDGSIVSDGGGSDASGDESGMALDQISIFSFLNGMVECGTPGKEKLTLDQENNIYVETMILFHLLLKHRIDSLLSDDTQRLQSPVMNGDNLSMSATTTRRGQLCKDIRAKEVHTLEKYITWSRFWLKSRIMSGSSAGAGASSTISQYDQVLAAHVW